MGFTWQYYDLVLGAIFLSVALGAVVGVLSPVPLATAVAGAAVVSVALIGHALFVAGPVDEVGDLAEEVEALN